MTKGKVISYPEDKISNLILSVLFFNLTWLIILCHRVQVYTYNIAIFCRLQIASFNLIMDWIRI